MKSDLKNYLPFPVSCSTAEEWLAIRHSWLERRLLPQLRDKRSDWVESDMLPDVLLGIRYRLEATRDLLSGIVKGFSPSQLVDTSPLGSLPEPIRAAIREAVHSAYLERQIVQPLKQDIEAAVTELELAAHVTERNWNSNAEIRCGLLEQIETAAQHLWRAINNLPEGVILP